MRGIGDLLQRRNESCVAREGDERCGREPQAQAGDTEWRRRWKEFAGRSRRPSDEVSLTTVILGLAVGALLTVTTGLWCMRQLEEFGPSVGGIIVFKPDPIASERWVINAVRLEHGFIESPKTSSVRNCVISPGVMARAGGSLVIEARRMSRPPAFRVHWAGGHTDNGPGDCGVVADLLLERTDVMRLANAAGGFNGGLRLIGP